MESAKSYYSSLDMYTNFLDMIFKFYPEGVACKDSELRYSTVNIEYCKIFSIDNSRDILSSGINSVLSRENLRLINDADNEVKKNLHPLNYVINTNNDRILNVVSSPIVKDSEFLGLISCIKDITQEETLKENFVNKHFKYLNAEKLLQSQRETFVASVSHDLKNPTLAQIRGLELILKGAFGNVTHEQSELLEMILDSCRYMNGMLSSLLTTYRNYGGAVKLNFTEFSFSELVEECTSEMIYVAKDKSLNIIKNITGENIICADKVQIKRVIMNLLSNGIKYAYKNSDLRLTINSSSDEIVFEFENCSPYIPEEKQKSIFAKYVSYAGAHKELGIGLGLYASKKIVESHCGQIYVKSFKDDRNVFGFIIPIKQKNGCAKKLYL